MKVSHARVLTLTLLAMIAFAANTILCRLALNATEIDAASFTTIRLASGALALFAYAAPFSFAYITLETGVGALLLFGAVQSTMILTGLGHGERLAIQQSVGLALALRGSCTSCCAGSQRHPLSGSILMLAAGIAWGV